MSFNHLSHVVPAAAETRARVAPSKRAEQSAVLLAAAKLVLIAGALGILGLFMPMWLAKLVELGAAESWYTLRLLALGGGAGIITLLVLVLKLWTNLVRELEEVKR
jgi:hypothetical protein